ncbi:MAG: flagellar biosynthetic protein FliO [Planctomycetaceae bacterium]|nr:flagellar biosynthetic protein FliO [Planctomycetaceae bacterium]
MPSPRSAALRALPIFLLLICGPDSSPVCQADDPPVYRPQDPHRLLTARPTFAPPLLSLPAAADRSSRTPAAAATAPRPDAIRSDPTGDIPTGTPFLDLTNPQNATPSATGQGIDQDMLINFGLWMVVILCLCGLSVVGLKMLQRRGIIKAGSAGPSTGHARVIDSLSLGRNQFVQLIEIGGRQVLLASDTSGIREMVPLADEFDASLLEASEQLEDAA